MTETEERKAMKEAWSIILWSISVFSLVLTATYLWAGHTSAGGSMLTASLLVGGGLGGLAGFVSSKRKAEPMGRERLCRFINEEGMFFLLSSIMAVLSIGLTTSTGDLWRVAGYCFGSLTIASMVMSATNILLKRKEFLDLADAKQATSV